MLVLTRKRDQKIRIGADVIITICEIQGNQVSIGIEAPADLKIARQELLDRDQQTNERQEAVLPALS